MLSRHYQPSTRINHFELDGLIAALRRQEDEVDYTLRDAYTGALIALQIFRYHEFLDTQADFMRLFEHYLQQELEVDNGIG